MLFNWARNLHSVYIAYSILVIFEILHWFYHQFILSMETLMYFIYIVSVALIDHA